MYTRANLRVRLFSCVISALLQGLPSYFLLTFTVACAISAAMELADMFDDINSLGQWRWDESILDFLGTILFPGMALHFVRFSQRRRSDELRE